jgi:hypothetical protein
LLKEEAELRDIAPALFYRLNEMLPCLNPD